MRCVIRRREPSTKPRRWATRAPRYQWRSEVFGVTPVGGIHVASHRSVALRQAVPVAVSVGVLVCDHLSAQIVGAGREPRKGPVGRDDEADRWPHPPDACVIRVEVADDAAGPAVDVRPAPVTESPHQTVDGIAVVGPDLAAPRFHVDHRHHVGSVLALHLDMRGHHVAPVGSVDAVHDQPAQSTGVQPGAGDRPVLLEVAVPIGPVVGPDRQPPVRVRIIEHGLPFGDVGEQGVGHGPPD